MTMPFTLNFSSQITSTFSSPLKNTSLTVPLNMTSLQINKSGHTLVQNPLLSTIDVLPSLCSVYQVDQLLDIITQLEQTIENQNKTILGQQNTISHFNRTIEQKDDIITKHRNVIKNERNKKRELISILSEHGFCNQKIRQAIGSFEYSAEIRKYYIQQITDLDNGKDTYTIGDELEGVKRFYFTNSSNTTLDLNQLRMVHVNGVTKLTFIECTFEKDDDDDDNVNWPQNIVSYYNHYHKNNKFAKDKNDRDTTNGTAMIYPGGHFRVTFIHPIYQRIGSHKISYRLYSDKKANTLKTTKKIKKGAFGQTIEFCYEVKQS